MPTLSQHERTSLYPLKVIKNEEDYKAALESMEAVFDETKGELAEYAETLAILIEKFEDEHFPTKEATGVEILKFLMEQNGLKQRDLIGILGSKSTVSEVLNGKRALNLHHIKRLAERFKVNPATFI